MVMFLMVLCLSMFGLALTSIAFAAATGGLRNLPEAEPEKKLALELPKPRFFTDDVAVPAAQPRVPLEVLLAQIERHVRLEQAAAESFLVSPTAESLHSRTMSPLMH